MLLKLTQWTRNGTGDPVWVNTNQIASFKAKVTNPDPPGGTTIARAGLPDLDVLESPDRLFELFGEVDVPEDGGRRLGERAGPEPKTQSLEDQLVRHRQRLERHSEGHMRGSSDE